MNSDEILTLSPGSPMEPGGPEDPGGPVGPWKCEDMFIIDIVSTFAIHDSTCAAHLKESNADNSYTTLNVL